MTKTKTVDEGWTVKPVAELGTGWKGDVVVDDTDGEKVWEYECLQLREDGTFVIETLAGMSTDHAFEEASYEHEGTCVAVRRGAYLYDNG